MPKHYGKQHEREENRRLSKSLSRSIAAICTCWLPVVGLALSISAFWRAQIRITRRHRARRRRLLLLSFSCLLLCTAVLLGEIRLYSRDPQILARTAHQVWVLIVGEEQAGALSKPTGTEYDDMDTAGLGVPDTLTTPQDSTEDPFTEDWLEGDFSEEDWADLEEEFDWSAWETDAFGEEWVFFEDDNALSQEEELSLLPEDTGDTDTAPDQSLFAGSGEAIIPPME